jgi:hypothetical protein
MKSINKKPFVIFFLGVVFAITFIIFSPKANASIIKKISTGKTTVNKYSAQLPLSNTSDENISVGWNCINGKWSYTDSKGEWYSDGVYNIDDKRYCFDSDGFLVIGIHKVDKKLFYFSESGNSPENGLGVLAKYNGWKKLGSKIFYFNADYSPVTGWKDISKERYFFSANGVLKTGWKKIGKYKYFFKVSGKLGRKGRLVKNRIAGNKKLGYAYVDFNGRRVTTKAIILATKFVLKHTSIKKSKAKKLRACFNYLWRHYPYKRVYGLPTAKTLSEKYAGFMLKNKKGNCFCYGAAFACVAKVIGYKSRMGSGLIAAAGGGMTVHGWTEVKMGGKWYMCDPDMQREIPGINMYLRTRNNYPYRLSCNTHYRLKIKKAKLLWKKQKRGVHN